MKRILFVFGLCMAAAGAQAGDVGSPIFPTDIEDKTGAELIYQNVTRELDTGADLEGDIYVLRVLTGVGQYGTLDFDVGGIDPSGGDFGFYGGVGLRFLAYDKANWRVSPWLQAHYAPGLDDEGADYDLLDGDAGVLLAAKIEIDKQLTVMPYAGPILSIIRIYGGDPVFGETSNSDPGEDQVLGAVAGVTLLMRGQNTIRVEAQFFDQVSLSAGAGITF